MKKMRKIVICIYHKIFFTKELENIFKMGFSLTNPKIQFYQGDIQKILIKPGYCFLSPANSFGFMDGGIDENYSKMFPKIQNLVQLQISQYPFKTAGGASYLPIGSSLLLHLKEKCFFVSAPTMYRPENVSHTQNAYIAMLSTLSLIGKQMNGKITTLIVPMLCTGYGEMSHIESAKQMIRAIKDYFDHGKIIETSDPKNRRSDSVICEFESL